MKSCLGYVKWLLAAAFALAVLFSCASAATVDSGTCSDGLSWELDDAGTLTISGNGPMADYGFREYSNSQPATTAPWGIHCMDILNVLITDGVMRPIFRTKRARQRLTAGLVPFPRDGSYSRSFFSMSRKYL